jgi:hypothetical protein
VSKADSPTKRKRARVNEFITYNSPFGKLAAKRCNPYFVRIFAGNVFAFCVGCAPWLSFAWISPPARKRIISFLECFSPIFDPSLSWYKDDSIKRLKKGAFFAPAWMSSFSISRLVPDWCGAIAAWCIVVLPPWSALHPCGVCRSVMCHTQLGGRWQAAKQPAERAILKRSQVAGPQPGEEGGAAYLST